MMNIYVGNLSSSTSEDTLKDLFSQHGQVNSVKIITDKFTQAPRGFAFVEMGSAEEAQKAIAEINGQEVDGKQLRVNEARPREAGGRGGSSSYGGGSGGFKKRTPRY